MMMMMMMKHYDVFIAYKFIYDVKVSLHAYSVERIILK